MPHAASPAYDAMMTESGTVGFAAAIRTLNRYFRLLDEKAFDVDLFAELFTPAAVILRPNGTMMIGPNEIVLSHRESFSRFAATQHMLTGHDVEIEGNGLSVRANLMAVHLWGDNADGVISGPDDAFIAGAVINASIVTAEPGWRIARLENTNVWKAGSGFASMAATPGKP